MAMFVQSLGDEYEAQTLIPYISNGPPIFWMYPCLESSEPTQWLDQVHVFVEGEINE
jgi:uncharacterized membrane protein YkgB